MCLFPNPKFVSEMGKEITLNLQKLYFKKKRMVVGKVRLATIDNTVKLAEVAKSTTEALKGLKTSLN